MILCSKLKKGLCKTVTKSQVVTKFNVTKSRLHCTYQHINEKSEILFSASVLQKNVICRVGFLYWKENPLSIRTPSTWDSKPEILHFSRLQFHACFQITLDAQVLTHSAHFCWPSRAASEYRSHKDNALPDFFICRIVDLWRFWIIPTWS